MAEHFRPACVVAACALLLFGGCGEGGSEPGGSQAEDRLKTAWVDPDGDPPYIGSLSVNPADGSLFLASNTGLFRIPTGDSKPMRVTGTLKTPDASGEISEALVVRFTGPDEAIASGHPASGSDLPPVLGLIRSNDAGTTWQPVSEFGTSDFHVLARSKGTLVAPQYGQSLILASEDEGRSWTQRVAPMPLVDLAVDPGNPATWVASTDQGLFTSIDAGQTWRQRDVTPSVRLAWHRPRVLYRIDPGGPLKVSADGGETWEDRGDAGGEPQALTLDVAGTLYVAALDGTVKRSDDGGRTWTEVLTPDE